MTRILRRLCGVAAGLSPAFTADDRRSPNRGQLVLLDVAGISAGPPVARTGLYAFDGHAVNPRACFCVRLIHTRPLMAQLLVSS